MKEKAYTISQEKESGLWYIHMTGFPYIPVFGSFNKSKRKVQNDCAKYYNRDYDYTLKNKEKEDVKMI